MNISYRYISKIYELIDVYYFKDNDANPRKQLIKCINNANPEVLDLCIGTATNSILLSKTIENVKITGIDISSEMIEIAKRKIEKQKIDNIKILKMDATEMDFPVNSFDIIIISLFLHEIDEITRGKILSESLRILKGKGKILILEWEKPKNILSKCKFLIIKLFESKGFTDFLQLNYEKYFEDFGLEIINTYHCDYSKVVELQKKTTVLTRT